MNKSETAGGGPLLAEDYRKARKEVSDIVIAPFDENKAKGVGYNLAASMLVYSVNKKQLVKVKENDREVYIEIAPHDTVLTLSHEYLVVDGDIAGTFHSKVRCSAMGLGNVSTTLDPNWRGKLLFSLNNPTKRKIKLVIEEKNDGARKAVGLITMVLYRIAGKEEHITAKELHLDNPPMGFRNFFDFYLFTNGAGDLTEKEKREIANAFQGLSGADIEEILRKSLRNAIIDASFGMCYTSKAGMQEFRGCVPLETTWDEKYEKSRVENGFKWSPIKSYYRKISSKGIKAGENWKIRINLTPRNGLVVTAQEFVLIITIRDAQGHDIYSEVVNGLRERGYITNNLETRQQIRQRQ